MPEGDYGIGPTGRYSPLRYPGGKGKLSRYMAALVRANGLSDGTYIEPYAGGGRHGVGTSNYRCRATRADQRHQSARVRLLDECA